MSRLLFLTSLCVLTLFASATAAQAAAIHESIPVSFTADNPCNGEAVSVTGTVDFVINTLANPAVEYIAAENGRYEVTGVGATTGSKYVVRDVLHVSTVVTSFTTGAPLQSTLTELFHLVSQGSAPDFWSLAVFHVTVTANGDITVNLEFVPQACRG
jgi:hypothetical protein